MIAHVEDLPLVPAWDMLRFERAMLRLNWDHHCVAYVGLAVVELETPADPEGSCNDYRVGAWIPIAAEQWAGLPPT